MEMLLWRRHGATNEGVISLWAVWGVLHPRRGGYHSIAGELLKLELDPGFPLGRERKVFTGSHSLVPAKPIARDER